MNLRRMGRLGFTDDHEAKTSNRTGKFGRRHYRGAFENVAMVEMRTQLAIERAGLVTLHLQLARRSSIPTIDRGCCCRTLLLHNNIDEQP